MTHPLPPGCDILGYGPVWRPAAAWPGPEVHGWLQILGSYCSTHRTETPVVTGSYVCQTQSSVTVYLLACITWYEDINTPLVSSFRTTSEISNSLRGRGIFLLAASVFRSPGRREVRATYRKNSLVSQISLLTDLNLGKHPLVDKCEKCHSDVSVFLWVTWNSADFGLEMWTALVSVMFFLSLSAISSCEHCRERKDCHIIEKITQKNNICYIVLVAVHKNKYTAQPMLSFVFISDFNEQFFKAGMNWKFLFLSACYFFMIMDMFQYLWLFF